MINKEQIDFFETFGFIKFSGLFKNEIEGITDEFENVFPMFPDMQHDGSKRSMIVPFIDQREKLSALLDDPRIYAICVGLLGKDFNYMGSDGNYYVGDTKWHPDGQSTKRKHIKIAFYLDKLEGSNGALRVLPGSHRLSDHYSQDISLKVKNSGELWGISGDQVPAFALDTVPGDVLVFNHSTFHSSWGGSEKRRMFTINLSQRYQPNDLDELRKDLVNHAHYRRDAYYGEVMTDTANVQRKRHLEQVISVSQGFSELTQNLPEMKRIWSQ